jgi:hypothetical protein
MLHPCGLIVCAHATLRALFPEKGKSHANRYSVVFQKWRWPLLHRPSKGISVHKQANHSVVHLYGFREADGLTYQAFDARP